MKRNVSFKSAGDIIAGNLYLPEGFKPEHEYPAIVVAGPLGTVKEQTQGLFAEALAKKGFATLAFDYRTFGESEGTPRQYENPANKTEDIQNAISFLGAHANVDANRIVALGICASSSYMAPAVSSDRRVKAFATVSAHFSLREFFLQNPWYPPEMLDKMYAASNAARQQKIRT